MKWILEQGMSFSGYPVEMHDFDGGLQHRYGLLHCQNVFVGLCIVYRLNDTRCLGVRCIAGVLGSKFLFM